MALGFDLPSHTIRVYGGGRCDRRFYMLSLINDISGPGVEQLVIIELAFAADQAVRHFRHQLVELLA